MNSYSITLERVRKNYPPIEPGQIWVGKNQDKILRKIRVLALYPECGSQKPTGVDGRLWIYEELPGGEFKTEIGRLGIFPEFNLRYVFELETGEDNAISSE